MATPRHSTSRVVDKKQENGAKQLAELEKLGEFEHLRQEDSEQLLR